MSNSYFGGKSGSGTFQTIINQLPPHQTYIELFGGKCGIFRNKKRASRNLIIELDKTLEHFYWSLGLDDIEETECDGIIRNYFYLGDAIDYIGSDFDNDCSSVLIYADPPYPLSSRKSPRDRYINELTDEQHEELLQYLLSYRNAKIAISTYPNDIYSRILGNAGWRMLEFESTTRRGKAIEQLWMNYEEPNELHDYQYLGKNYREREKIARLQRRWKAKLLAMPVQERNAMIMHLQN